MISKEVFVETIKSLESAKNAQWEIEKIIHAHKASGFFDTSGLIISHEDTVVKLLENIFNNANDISYFIYELDFGKKYVPGCVTFDNKKIDLSSAEKLYDCITGNPNYCE